MNIKHIQILADAESDLYDGQTFYDKQGEHIGDYFWDSLLSDIESLLIFAGIHRKEFGYYRMLSKRFPYAIYYDVNGDVASVIAVLPIRKDPMWIKDKMDGKAE
ncbi:MAG: type II toxin-antitoxin system RelE/ParE family toxin [Methylovulum sp.]|nr:type II toxin-antitoxin system RelE/ParE family toxin [Methylovulum sp.]